MHPITDTQFKNLCLLKMEMNAHFCLHVCNKDLVLKEKMLSIKNLFHIRRKLLQCPYDNFKKSPSL